MLAPVLAIAPDPKAEDAPPALWQYTGYDGADKTLSMLISFFLQSFDNGRFAFMPEFIASVGPAVIVPIIEMRRSGYQTTTVFVFTLVLGFFYQNFGAGVILPLWWALYLLVSGRGTTPLQPQYAKATLVGYFLGYVAISMAMTAFQTPGVIAAWQFCPAYVLVVQAISLGAQTEKASNSSYDTLQFIYTFNFGWSAVTHAYTLLKAFNSSTPLNSLMDFYMPNYSVSTDPILVLFKAFCKWDHIYIAVTTLFVGLWYLRGTSQRLLALGWFVLGSLLFGTGAGLSGVWMMREKQLKEGEKAPEVRLKQN
ncbi:hypothetical protein FRC07_006294 [Ceratobasidium sp. 392]|nr:hypothetical protein FRC07_006294 [Ceratobasidium sp. 392]